ncbi:unnamed protein product [Prorocentrum cordatum]|uniref:Peptidase M16 N-terminal domain-containing protein n=1 Tax=Prorocentrum cordatum TaxID=2364126 RepID=A0ABN9R9G0_9DINO|nr:unnamed protein product [Polarella glacialis]
MVQLELVCARLAAELPAACAAAGVRTLHLEALGGAGATGGEDNLPATSLQGVDCSDARALDEALSWLRSLGATRGGHGGASPRPPARGLRLAGALRRAATADALLGGGGALLLAACSPPADLERCVECARRTELVLQLVGVFGTSPEDRSGAAPSAARRGRRGRERDAPLLRAGVSPPLRCRLPPEAAGLSQRLAAEPARGAAEDEEFGRQPEVLGIPLALVEVRGSPCAKALMVRVVVGAMVALHSRETRILHEMFILRARMQFHEMRVFRLACMLIEVDRMSKTLGGVKCTQTIFNHQSRHFHQSCFLRVPLVFHELHQERILHQLRVLHQKRVSKEHVSFLRVRVFQDNTDRRSMSVVSVIGEREQVPIINELPLMPLPFELPRVLFGADGERKGRLSLKRSVRPWRNRRRYPRDEVRVEGRARVHDATAKVEPASDAIPIDLKGVFTPRATPESAAMPIRPAARPPACAPVSARVTGQGSGGTAAGSTWNPFAVTADANSAAHRVEADKVHDSSCSLTGRGDASAGSQRRAGFYAIPVTGFACGSVLLSYFMLALLVDDEGEVIDGKVFQMRLIERVLRECYAEEQRCEEELRCAARLLDRTLVDPQEVRAAMREQGQPGASRGEARQEGVVVAVGVVVLDDRALENAFAMAVQSGSSNDPLEFPGLAHFCEHMVFLGTEKYPEPSGFDNFMGENGGSNNAYTSFDLTVYFGQISSAVGAEAMDRFADFFRKPLFNRSFVEKEVHAIDSEHAKNVQSHSNRIIETMYSLASSDNPLSRFHTGNLETLYTEPMSKNKNPVDALEVYFQRHDGGLLP